MSGAAGSGQAGRQAAADADADADADAAAGAAGLCPLALYSGGSSRRRRGAAARRTATTARSEAASRSMLPPTSAPAATHGMPARGHSRGCSRGRIQRSPSGCNQRAAAAHECQSSPDSRDASQRQARRLEAWCTRAAATVVQSAFWGVPGPSTVVAAATEDGVARRVRMCSEGTDGGRFAESFAGSTGSRCRSRSPRRCRCDAASPIDGAAFADHSAAWSCRSLALCSG